MVDITRDEATPTLRQRMIEDMEVRRLSRATQRNYLRDVARFASWLGQPPDLATAEDLRRYQVEQSATGTGAPTMNAAVSALRFFYTRTLNRPDLTRKLHNVKHARALPTVLSREEVARMLEATTSVKHRRSSRSPMRWPARLGGRRAQGPRRRQQPHAAQGRVRQGWAAPQRHARQ